MPAPQDLFLNAKSGGCIPAGMPRISGLSPWRKNWVIIMIMNIRHMKSSVTVLNEAELFVMKQKSAISKKK